ncbi:MAG: DUF2142 domain-containing protein [Actinomycetales bacterium]|nr:DUF2142 domain-containing protein [Actinomycetales bacterium]
MTDLAPGRIRRRLGRIRPIWFAPVLAFVALAAWAFASPIGAAPDDDYHLVSTWCAVGGGEQCQPGSDPLSRDVDAEFSQVVCFAGHKDVSAACQESGWGEEGVVETDRGNFGGEYPPVYYATMHLFAGADIQSAALAMRLINAALFVALATALSVLLPATRVRTLLWGWLIATIPLGIFLIPSNNPSGWAVTGVGTAFLALLGWFETTGRRRWVLAALYLVGVVMAAGSRGDAGVYAIGASVTASIIASRRTRDFLLRSLLALAGVVIAVIFFVNAGQSGVGAVGFTGAEAGVGAGGGSAVPLSGFALAAYNLLMLPYLWTGVWGTWALGWFDTGLPAIVPWAAVAAFVAIGFTGLGRMDWRKAVSVAGVVLVLTVLPVYVLTVGHTRVGEALQPRYLLPLILLLALLLATMPPGRELRLSRLQTAVVLGALAIANLVALQADIRRYVTGADRQGLNLDAGAEWWWTGFPVGPTAVWVVGTLAYVGMLVLLWPRLRPTELTPSVR